MNDYLWVGKLMRTWPIADLIDALDPSEYPLRHRLCADAELHRRLRGRN